MSFLRCLKKIKRPLRQFLPFLGSKKGGNCVVSSLYYKDTTFSGEIQICFDSCFISIYLLYCRRFLPSSVAFLKGTSTTGCSLRGTGFEHFLTLRPASSSIHKKLPNIFMKSMKTFGSRLFFSKTMNEQLANKNNRLSSQTISFTCQLINLLA